MKPTYVISTKNEEFMETNQPKAMSQQNVTRYQEIVGRLFLLVSIWNFAMHISISSRQ